jgi:hypothetical protein
VTVADDLSNLAEAKAAAESGGRRRDPVLTRAVVHDLRAVRPLEPGTSERVSATVDPAATNHPLSVWDDGAHDFVVVPGEYTIFVGMSSEDTPLPATVAIS